MASPFTIPNITAQARIIATFAHHDQKYGSLPYIVHPEAVVRTLQEFSHHDPLDLAVGWLHDVVKDTPWRPEDLLGWQMPIEVVEAVVAVTDARGKNRKVRQAHSYPHICSNIRALKVKLADRLTNMRHSLEDNPTKVKMYRSEYPAFRKALYTSEPSLASLWEALDTIAKI